MAHYLLLARSHPDNSPLENFFNIIENEMFYGRDWEGVSLEELGRKTDGYIEWHNAKKINRSLGSTSPLQYRQSLGLTASTEKHYHPPTVDFS